MIGRVDVVAEFGHQVDKQIPVGRLVVLLEKAVDESGHRGLRSRYLFGVFAEQASRHAVEPEREQANIATDESGLEGIDLSLNAGVRVFVVRLDQFQGFTVFRLAVGVGVDPIGEAGFERLLLGFYVQALQAFGLADVIFPVVRRLCVLRCILNANRGVSIHVGLHGFQFEVAHIDYRWVVEAQRLVDAPAAQEAVGASGVAHDHGEVAFGHAVHADAEVALGLVGDVAFAVVSRFVVFVGVNAQHGEITGVTGPHPVVRVAAVLAHAFRRCSHEADVAVRLVLEHVKLVVVVEALQLKLLVAFWIHFFHQGLARFCDGCVALVLGHLHCDILQDACGDVVDAHQETDNKIVDVHFLVVGQREEAVGQVVVLCGRESLDGVISAVVVGQYQSL